MRERAPRLVRGIDRVERAAIRERRPETHDTRRRSRFADPPAVFTRQRRGARTRSVKRPVRGQHLVPSRDRSRELYRVFVRLRTARREEHAAAFVRPRRESDDRFRELRTGVVEPARRCETDPVDLLVHRAENGRVAVAEIRRDEPGGEIHVARAVRVVEMDARTANDDGRIEAGLRGPRRQDVATMALRDLARRGLGGGEHPVRFTSTRDGSSRERLL